MFLVTGSEHSADTGTDDGQEDQVPGLDPGWDVARNRRWGRRGMLVVVGAAGLAALAVSCTTDASESSVRGSTPPEGVPPTSGGVRADDHPSG